jgi:hypothetical protein
MTITSTQAKANVRKGKECERMAARFLTVALGLPEDRQVIRYVRAGHSAAKDPGDLDAGQGLICSVKDSERLYVATWLQELDEMAGPDTAVRFLIHKWRQHPIATWHVYVRAGMLVPLTTVERDEASSVQLIEVWARRVRHATPGERLRVPVRLDLGAFATMLVLSGFGEHRYQHIEET